VNQAFTAITGYCASDVVGRDQDLLSTGMNDAALREVIWSGIHGTGHWQGEVFDRRKGGELFPMHLTITAVKDEAGTVTHYVTAMTDITLRKAAAKEIERLAFLDPLTGLPNRRLLLDRLQQALSSSARSGRKGALLFLDLDHFKVLNDTLGHDFGDVLLRQVAQRLSAAVREGDTVARLGGDEFVVLLEDLSEELIEAAEQAQSVGEKVLLSQQQPYTIATHQHHSSCSMGAVVFGGQHQSVDELLKQADLAMYDAKAAGRNALRFFDPQMQASISARAVMENELHAALAAEQFVLHYQTQVTNEDQVIGAEGLIRWQHPQRGLVSPAEFISLAEETGLINPIGWWVLQTACAQLKAWEAVPALSALQLAVNVSARQFHKPDFVTQVMAALQQSGARSNLLKLELTESVVLKDIDDTIGKMNALKALGVRFSLDDFGTGQSSLSYLTQLPLDQIKIDRSFVQNIGEKPTDALIVQTIIGMARNLGLEVIAEGVETQAQRSFLEQHGCTLYQGYLFSRPVPIQQFERSM
jgi:diguanylate cyclase (GGDEF)-like protein/PAS domain S-box-containing protein